MVTLSVTQKRKFQQFLKIFIGLCLVGCGTIGLIALIFILPLWVGVPLVIAVMSGVLAYFMVYDA